MSKPLFLTPSDTFHQGRFNLAVSGTSVAYAAFSFSLYSAWYKGFEREFFHFFDDSKEWNQMDKAGHIYSSYAQGRIAYQGAKWTGLSESKAIWSGILASTLIQSTIEVFDGFSSKWGFSLSDYAANIIGVGAFGIQQKYWGDQRILMKVSSTPVSYPELRISSTDDMFHSTLAYRVNELFGSGYTERFLKDYNAQTIWASGNISAFFPKSKVPKWLNVALGYGSENMFGGFSNRWVNQNTATYDLDALLSRHRQYYLSLDIDFTRIKTKSPFLKSVLYLLNIFKFPSPTLEYNSLGETKVHWLFW